MSQSGTTSSATIAIEYRDQRAAEAILKAIEPDNLGVPEGITIEAWALDGVVTVTVDSIRGVGSLVATLDDLLSCIQAAEKAIEELS